MMDTITNKTTTTTFQLTSAIEIFIDKQAQNDDQFSTPSVRNPIEIESAASSSSQTRIATSNSSNRENQQGPQISERDFVLVVTLVGGVLLAAGLALGILVVIQMRKIKHEKQRHVEEMRRIKEVYENRLSQFSMSAIVDETLTREAGARIASSSNGIETSQKTKRLDEMSASGDENLNIVDNSDLYRAANNNNNKMSVATYFSAPTRPQASDFAVISSSSKQDDYDEDEDEDNLSMRF